jgi:hypothetical protein
VQHLSSGGGDDGDQTNRDGHDGARDVRDAHDGDVHIHGDVRDDDGRARDDGGDVLPRRKLPHAEPSPRQEVEIRMVEDKELRIHLLRSHLRIRSLLLVY